MLGDDWFDSITNSALWGNCNLGDTVGQIQLKHLPLGGLKKVQVLDRNNGGVYMYLKIPTCRCRDRVWSRCSPPHPPPILCTSTGFVKYMSNPLYSVAIEMLILRSVAGPWIIWYHRTESVITPSLQCAVLSHVWVYLRAHNACCCNKKCTPWPLCFLCLYSILVVPRV